MSADKKDASFERVFERVAIISLASRTDRRQDVTEELAQVGLEPGTGGVAFFDAIRPEEPSGFPSIGARGCFLSHLTLLEECERKGVNSVLILEDDVGFVRNIADGMRMTSAGLLQHEWDIFYGGYGNVPAEVFRNAQNSLVAIEPEYCIGLTHCIGLRGEAIPEAAAYLRAMLSRPGGSPEGGPMHVDGAYSWYRKKHPERRTLAASPAIAYQRPSRSDILENLAWYDRSKFLRPVISSLRRWKRHLSAM